MWKKVRWLFGELHDVRAAHDYLELGGMVDHMARALTFL